MWRDELSQAKDSARFHFRAIRKNRSERTDHDEHALAAQASAAVNAYAWLHKRRRIRATTRDPSSPGGDAFIISTNGLKHARLPEKQPDSRAVRVCDNVVHVARGLLDEPGNRSSASWPVDQLADNNRLCLLCQPGVSRDTVAAATSVDGRVEM